MHFKGVMTLAAIALPWEMAEVRGIEEVPGYLWSGQLSCHSTDGHLISCEGSGQDAEFQYGAVWPEPRFHVESETIYDHLPRVVLDAVC